MVSDSELVQRLREFLSTSDLETTTTAIVRRRLEKDFGIDLSQRKAFVREQVDIYLMETEDTKDEFEDNAVNESEAVKEEENEEEEEAEEEEEEAEEEEEEEAEEEEEEEEEESNATTERKSSTKKQKKTARKGGGGFCKLCRLSLELQELTGVPELARTEVVKQLWSYIKENNLQDPSNRQNILCDDLLRNLFGLDMINMFQMSKALTKHIFPLDSDGAAGSSIPKEKRRKKERDEDEEPQTKEKRQKRGNSALLTPLKLSDALVKFLGTGESELPRSDVVKRIWDHIKQNNLQDPSDRRRILCDEKLKELFDIDTFQGFHVAKYLTAHFIKSEQ